MPIRFWGRKERQSQSPSEVSPVSRLDDAMVMELLQRVAQLAGVLEGVAGALSDSAGFCREVSASATDIAGLIGERGVWVEETPAVQLETMLSEADQLSRHCAFGSVRMMEGIQALAEMAEQSLMLLMYTETEPQGALRQDPPQRAVELVRLAEQARQRAADLIGLQHQVGQTQSTLRQILQSCRDKAAAIDAQDPILRIGRIAAALSEAAQRQSRGAEQLAPVTEALMRDAGEIRRLLSALVSEGTAATLP